MPELFEVVIAPEGGVDALPEPTAPYYVLAKEGMFLHRHTQIGNVLLPHYKKPEGLNAIGYSAGVFLWGDNAIIPAKIISQAYDFFKRIYTKHKTEAEVLITMHNETGEYKLFVPYQRTSGGGVKSIYEPTHVHKDWLVVGTLHSHCMMGAFHSGTDTGDASDMDGVHFTMGKILNDPPDIVAMVSMGGKNFHYTKPEKIAELDYHKDTAPEWWDTFVYPANIASEKPKALKSLTQAQWDEFRGVVVKIHHQNQNQKKDSHAWSWTPGVQNYQPNSNWEPRQIAQPTTESRIFNERSQKPTEIRRRYDSAPPHWGPDGELEIDGDLWGPNEQGVYVNLGKENQTDKQINKATDIAAERGLLTIEDWAKIRASQLDEISFWRSFFAKKMSYLGQVLATLDMQVEFAIRHKNIPSTVKGQMPLPDNLTPKEN